VGDDAPGMAGERTDEIVLPRRQPDFFPLHEGAAGGEIDLQFGAPESRLP